MFDSHAHINTTDIARYPVSPVDGHLPETALSDAFPAAALIAAMDQGGVDRALVVQRSHVYGYDNRYILDSAAASGGRIRPLCVIDGRAPDAEAQATDAMARGSVGVRFMEPEKGKGLDWLASDHAARAWAATVAAGGSIRVHLFRWNRDAGLAAIADHLRAVPDTVLVLDHLSNLDPANGDHGIDDALRHLAQLPRVYLMLSSINLRRWAGDTIDPRPVIAGVVAQFGANRVMWGSDVGNTPGGYGDMIANARAACADLSEQDQRQLFHDTAAKVYA